MNEILDVAIIGTGNIAGGFDENSVNKEAIYSHAGAYRNCGNFNLKSVFDLDKNRASEFAKYWNVSIVSDSENEIINGFHDIVSICTPDQFHFEILKKLIINKSCKTIFVEKPVALNLNDIEIIDTLSKKNNINVVVNFQRHFDDTYKMIQKENKILSVNSYYIKGLKHIGVTMIDTLIMLFGMPQEIYSFNKIHNKLINDDTYEFIFFYEEFNIVIQSIDQVNKYNYHIFDITVFAEDAKYTVTDNSNTKIVQAITDYDYSNVKVISSLNSEITNTEYYKSMLKSIEYLYDITIKKYEHTINKVSMSFNIHLIIDYIIESFEKNKKISLKDVNWKK